MDIVKTVLDALRDPLWQFVGAAFGLVSIGIALRALQSDKRQATKDITVKPLTNAPLFRVSSDERERVQVLFDGREVRNLRLLHFDICNTGQVPITRADFESPLRISLSPEAKISEIEVLWARPADLKPQFKLVRPNVMQLKPCLLNPGDLISAKIIATDSDGSLGAEARVIGVNRIQVLDWPSSGRHVAWRLPWAAMTVAGLAPFFFNLLTQPDTVAAWLFLMSVMALALMVVDKRQAIIAGHRLNEPLLHFLTLAGGSPGTLVASIALRHKTAKPGFMLTNLSAFLIQAIAVVLVLRPWTL